MLFYNELNNIRFYMGNPTLLENWQFFYLNQSIKETEWYQEVYQAQGKVGWYYIEDETKNNDKYLSFVRQIEFKDFETHGMMVITINPSYLHQILEQESFDTMIIDGNNVIIAARNSNLLGTHLEELDYNIIPLLTNTNRIEEIVINGKTSKIIVEDLN